MPALLRLLLVTTLLSTAAAFAENTGATPAEAITVAPGFKVELLKSADPKREGSWVCMAIDAKGRLYISPQGAIPESGFAKDSKWGGLRRVTLDDKGQIAAWEKVPVPVGDAMGMLWAFDSLYVSGNGPEGRALYRLRDSDGSDDLDQWTLFKKVPGSGGEHGAHALVLGPDGKSIYIVHGNSTPPIDGLDPQSPYRHYAEDDLLPRVMDPVATFFDKIKSPYGYVLRTDEQGSKWELIAGGFRNPYDIDFNADGELFTYDSDMEWDVGLPWYRPTRVLHVVPGGEYGFREGSAKWPAWYPDSLPAAVDIGLGSPTGVKFGTKSNFPEKYRRAFFIMDWTFARILAVHLHPKGASYTAKNDLPSPYHLVSASKSDDVEEFVKGKGLPVTDMEFGKDGAMYFTIGGRGTQAGLYRVSWDGKTNPPVKPHGVPRLSPDYYRRVTLEAAVLGHPGFRWGDIHWTILGSNDRFVRNAARQLIESRVPTIEWRERALSESEPRVALTALLALARVGTKDDQEAILKGSAKFPLDSLDDELKLLKLRVAKLTFSRQGRPPEEVVQIANRKLSSHYPSTGPHAWPLNRELCELLVWLGAPDVVEKTLALMDQSTEPAEQIWYALCLREATNWTPAQRERYFAWFAKAATFRGGNSLKKFLLRIRDKALEKLPAEERPALLALAEKPIAPTPAKPPVPPRAFVKAWTLDELLPALPGADKGRNFARGKALYTATMCAQCHQFAGEGGATGPDLTAVGSRFSRKDILEATLEPSKALSEQYASYLFTMKDGSLVGGQIAEENHYLLTLIVDPLTGAKQNFSKGSVVKREMSPVSLMPPALLFTLTQDEILDLLAYLESGGNEKAAAFAR